MRDDATGDRVRVALAAAMAVPALVLSACGGSTVDTAEIESEQSSASAAPGSAEASPSAAPSATRGTPAPGSQSPQVRDPGATRADEAPDNRMPLTPEDESFLDALEGAGIAVDGTEDQLIGAGHAHCGVDSALVDAVAGQLVAQGRTDRSPQDAAKAIADAADAAYC